MILVDGEKYACQQCIRGHRSSTCKHIQRPLVLVRSRGRPLTDSSQRIAIFAEEITNENEKKEALKNENNIKNNFLAAKKIITEHATVYSSSKNEIKQEPPVNSERSYCCSKIKPKQELKQTCSDSVGINQGESKCSCCSDVNGEGSKKQNDTVFVLKAAKRQVFNVEKESLRLLDPVMDIPNSKVGLDVIYKVSKSKKMQSCKNKRIKDDILRTINKPTGKTSCCGSKAQANHVHANPIESQVYQFKVNLGKPVEPSNNCSQNMQRKIIERHDQTLNSPYVRPSYINEYDPSIYSSSTQQSELINHNTANSNTIYPLSAPVDQLQYNLYVADSCTVPGSCACDPDKGDCPDCTEHQQFRDSTLTIRQQFEEFQFPNKENNHIRPFGKVELKPTIPQFEQSFIDMLNSYDDPKSHGDTPSSVELDDCYCEADKCCCFNCVQHGILNGIRLRDGKSIIEIQTTDVNQPNTHFLRHQSPSTPSSFSTSSENSNQALTDRDRWFQQHQSYINNQFQEAVQKSSVERLGSTHETPNNTSREYNNITVAMGNQHISSPIEILNQQPINQNISGQQNSNLPYPDEQVFTPINQINFGAI